MHEEIRNIPIENLRLWNKNPRYFDESKIIIDDIGMDDFEISDGFILKDRYEDNYIDYFKKLFNNLDSAKITFDLIESLSSGFNPALDDIFVVKPQKIYTYLNENDANFFYINKIFYVVEGNRRLVCLDLLKNYHNSRGILISLIENLETKKKNNLSFSKKDSFILDTYKDILEVCLRYDNNPQILSYIECREMDYNYYASQEGVAQLNKILNSRHFGNRKGKLNWPRGLILRKIFQLVKNQIRMNPNITEKELYKNIEKYVGKKIQSSDINAALFVNKCLDLWEKKYPSQRIDLTNTETGDIDQVNELIIYDNNGDEVITTEKTVGIYISSLENAKSNIKLYDKNFELTSLSKIINFKYYYKNILENNVDSDYFKIFFKEDERLLSKEDTEKILLEITKAVKNKEINTRSFAKNESSKVGAIIRDILYPNEILNKEKILNLNISQISSLKTPNLNNEEDNATIKNIASNLNKIIEDYDENSKIFNDAFKFKKNNIFIITIAYIWKTEYGRIVKFKDKTKLNDIPTLIFSLLYRTTYEFITHILTLKIMLDYLSKLDNPAYKANSMYEQIAETLFVDVNADILSKSKKSLFYFKNKSVDDFKTQYINASLLEKEAIRDDLNKAFFIIIGLEDFNLSSKKNITFKYFDDFAVDDFKRDNFYTTKHNADNYFYRKLKSQANNYNANSISSLLKEIEQECLSNNMFGIFNKNEKYKVSETFKLIKLFALETNLKGFQNKGVINRFIHKPLSALATYNNNLKNFSELNDLLILLQEVEKTILQILD